MRRSVAAVQVADADGTVDDIGGAFRVLARQRQLAADRQRNISVEERRQRLDRRSLTIGIAGQDANARAQIERRAHGRIGNQLGE